ncbi:MAG: GNAT family N-acetyltransferase [Phycisphaerales bacterium]|nr:GNAT family N-acetyltransferase [Phycisphaerales bacterium]
MPFQRHHQDGVVFAVKDVFDEYGFTWEADGYCRDLYNVEKHYSEPGGMFWAVLDGEQVIGCAGLRWHGEECELHRMYLTKRYRGRGLGRRLLETCMDCARERGCTSMRAWSDTTLVDAHRLYEKLGFVRGGRRICDDPDQSPEYGFWKEPL